MPALDRNGRMKIIENMNTNKKLLLLCVPLLLSACKERAVVPPMPSGVSVKVMEIEGGRVQYEQNYSGTVEAGFSVPLSFQTAGNLLQVLVSDGQSVREGQVLATLDPVSLQSAYDAAKAVLEQAEDAYLRYESLHEKGSMTDLQWREVLTKRQQALSMESIARRNLEHAVLKAPVDGIVAAKDIEAGMNVVPGMPVMKILCIDHVNVKIPVPENEISRTRIGQEATVKVPALQDRLFHGAVTEKGISANPVSRTYDVKIALDNHGHDLMPGMVCKVDIADTMKFDPVDGLFSIEHTQPSPFGGITADIRLAATVTMHDAVAYINDRYALTAFHELLPSMNEIFIETVSSNNHQSAPHND